MELSVSFWTPERVESVMSGDEFGICRLKTLNRLKSRGYSDSVPIPELLNQLQAKGFPTYQLVIIDKCLRTKGFFDKKLRYRVSRTYSEDDDGWLQHPYCTNKEAYIRDYFQDEYAESPLATRDE